MKIVICKQSEAYKVTNEQNYNNNMQNARQVHTMYGFENAQEIIEYYVYYFGSNKEDFIVIE